jgi:hypothetical protein
MGVGCIHTANGESLPYPFSWRDADADTRWMERSLKSFGVDSGSMIHISHRYAELVQYWPVYEAARNLGAIYANGMPTSFDAYRLEMYLRRFPFSAVIGITSETLDGLQHGGHDIENVFRSVRVLMALPNAAERLRTAGFDVATLLPMGPFLAIEAAPGEGARFNNREWNVEAIDNVLHITSSSARGAHFDRLSTGVKGHTKKVVTPLGPEWRIFAEPG